MTLCGHAVTLCAGSLMAVTGFHACHTLFPLINREKVATAAICLLGAGSRKTLLKSKQPWEIPRLFCYAVSPERVFLAELLDVAGEADCGTFLTCTQEVGVGLAGVRCSVDGVVNIVAGSAGHNSITGSQNVLDFDG